jgi:hypothetical protein
VKPGTICALKGLSAFERLKQRRRHSIRAVAIGTTPYLPTARLLALKPVKSYRDQGYGRPNGYFLLEDNTPCIFIDDSFRDGQVLYEGERVYVFAAYQRPDCAVQLAFEKDQLTERLVAAVEQLSESDGEAFEQLVAERLLPDQRGFVAFHPRTHLAALELATLRDLASLLHVTRM